LAKLFLAVQDKIKIGGKKFWRIFKEAAKIYSLKVGSA